MTIRKPHPNARHLRKDMPKTERRLWNHLRNKKLGGFRFRRQHTIGGYIADFACLEAKLVIELDGEQHALNDAPERDRARDAFMEQEGWLVLRFWNSQLRDNISGVLDVILEAAENSVRYLKTQRMEEDP